MSTRQLRKLQRQRELDRTDDLVEKTSDGESDVEEAVPAIQPRPNLFAALGGDDDDDGLNDEENQGSEEDETRFEGRQELNNETQLPKKSKKKKKKAKKGTKATKAHADAAEGVGGRQGEPSEEDEIDKAIKALNISPNMSSAYAAKQESKGTYRCRLNELLGINTHHLRPINEMRQLFGRDVMESASTEEQQHENNRRRRNATQQQDLETYLREPLGAPKLPQVSLRRNVFVQGRDHWPRQSAGGLTMAELDKSPDGSWTQYTYAHSKDYDGVQALFFACVQIGDPMRMVHLLKRFPYHVSTLLQVSSVAKQDQNMALAGELCERALFTFGRVTTSSFRQDIERGQARLDFCRPENRQFWLAGYHELKSLIQKGTYRTALEWSKLLFAMDRQDPYAMRHFIHVLALRAYESQWLIDFLDEAEAAGDHGDFVYIRQSLVLAKLQLGDPEGARRSLELGLDAPPSIWGVKPDSDAQSFWVKLYLHQTKDLWNNPQATGLVQDVAQGLTRADTTSLKTEEIPVDLGATRLGYLEGQTSLLAVAPRELLNRHPNYEFDPLPPPLEDNILTGESARWPWRERSGPDDGRDAALLAEMQDLIFGQPPLGRLGPLEDEEDYSDDEIRALREADDEELRRDIEDSIGGNSEPGILAMLMQMLGVNRGAGAESGRNDDDSEDEADQAEDAEDAEGLPGAWPMGGGGGGGANATNPTDEARR
ncbi:hypothetical protein DCS_06160 [Drechmeria coniospora]|uniref:Transcription factor 25 n=1 Tax=Drechmeria coniospora TaxID=98403 RepID=A0A151GAT5_DRECN|nr:hypothetical protein DCS_06160 [Drechmeria coniospora]KYK54203.1 hypothetical protein DCS_06160 [Drechmeria coniospora]